MLSRGPAEQVYIIDINKLTEAKEGSRVRWEMLLPLNLRKSGITQAGAGSLPFRSWLGPGGPLS
jgi:hypothetical protein